MSSFQSLWEFLEWLLECGRDDDDGLLKRFGRFFLPALPPLADLCGCRAAATAASLTLDHSEVWLVALGEEVLS